MHKEKREEEAKWELKVVCIECEKCVGESKCLRVFDLEQ